MADVVASTSQPPLGAVRLAWWRERLEALDQPDLVVPAEPRLEAVAEELLTRGVSGAELSALEDGWLPLLDPFPWGQTQTSALKVRGRLLFGWSARILGAPDTSAIAAAGELWSLVDGARHASDEPARATLLAAARERIGAASDLPRAVRPVSVLAALAAHDLATPDPLHADHGAARGWAALRHRLTGGLTR